MTTRDKFMAAVEIINSLPRNGTFQPSDDLLLKLYAFHKQAIDGPCKTPKPSIWDMSSRNKWNAWNALEDMSKETAMEKYIDELKKVIETMSYNEKVSKFMSLIGPFYEVVSTDEIDIQGDKDTKTKPAEYVFPEKAIASLKCAENILRKHSMSMTTCTKSEIVTDDSLPESCISTPIKVPYHSSTFCTNEGEEKTCTEKNAFDFFKINAQKNSLFSSQKDFLILALINLQNSMEDIVTRFDRVNNLAKITNFSPSQCVENPHTSEEWNLNFAGTAFALLWPLAVHLYFA